jgi:hypothetical protein
MRKMVTTVFKFNELNEAAKEKAKEWFRSVNLEYDWWDDAYESAKTAGEILGIDMSFKDKNPCIWFSGFSCQGDGACFEGSYSYKADMVKNILIEFPKDERLARIAVELSKIQENNDNVLQATVRHSGYYYHQYCTLIDVTNVNGDDVDKHTQEAIKDVLRDFMQWIYELLNDEYESLQSDKNVVECIMASGYEFREDGKKV